MNTGNDILKEQGQTPTPDAADELAELEEMILSVVSAQQPGTKASTESAAVIPEEPEVTAPEAPAEAAPPVPDVSEELAELEEMILAVVSAPRQSAKAPAEPEEIPPEKPDEVIPEEPETVIPEEPEAVAPEAPEEALPEEPEEIIPADMEALFPEELEEIITEELEEIAQEEPEEIPEERPRKAPAAAAPAKPKKKRRFRGALWFYSILLICTVGILVLLYCLRTPLLSWLKQYEAVQPQYTAAEIYDLLFADPDWSLLYDMAELQPTEFEGRKEFVAYMEAKVGDSPLTCTEVAAGLSGERRYSIRLGEEEVASYTMVPENDHWTIGTVEVYFTRTESVSVTVMPGYTVYINGVPLDERYTTQTTYTLAEDYLPDGLHGYRCQQQRVTGLLMPPEVVVLDERNNPLPLSRDPITGHYAVPIADTEPMTQEQADRALEAAKAEALFSIRAISITELRQHFDPGGQAYEQISAGNALVRDYESYEFDEAACAVDGYYRYSSDLFSIRATVKLNVTDQEGETTALVTSVTYFFEPHNTGTDMVSQRVEADLQQRITQIPLSYVYRDTVLQTDIVSADITLLTPPLLTDPDGVWPLGWAKMEADGTMTMVLELQPDGTAVLREGQVLEAMTLYPVFPQEGGTN